MDFSGLKTFLGELWVPLALVAIVFIGKFWKNSEWLKIIGIIVVYAIMLSLTKGTQILQTVSKVLNLFGIDLGI